MWQPSPRAEARRELRGLVSHARHAAQTDPAPGEVSVYAVDPADWVPQGDHVILRSYLDVVMQGFLHVFGSDGAAQFVRTTDGWDIPIRDDRAAPIYPRAQVLTAEETALVDALLREMR